MKIVTNYSYNGMLNAFSLELTLAYEKRKESDKTYGAP